MKRLLRLCLIALSLTHFIPFTASAEDAFEQTKDFMDDRFAQWHISGQNTLRSEYYSVKGDPAAAPYRFEGSEFYDEVDLNFTRRMTPYNTWRGQVFGLYNDSDYRNAEYGLIPERLNLHREMGESIVPYRFDVGDFYGYTSFRTLQTSLKGAQFELQPSMGSGDWRQSFLFISGANQPTWDNFQRRDSYTNAASWLFGRKGSGAFSLNYVQNRRKGDVGAGTLERHQRVMSLTGHRPFIFGPHKITLEGEISHFEGDHDGLAGVESGQGRKEQGLYFQASGKGGIPLTYRLRYEEYGQDYRPVGVAVPADRRSGEGHLAWRFKKGLQARGRVQYFRDSLETLNPTDTMTYGINFTGPLFQETLKNMSGSLDAFRQEVESREPGTDTLTTSVNLNLNKPIFGNLNARLGVYYQDLRNRVPPSSLTRTRQASLNVDHAVGLWGFKGTIAPGITVRDIDNIANKSSEILPALSLNVSNGPHSLDFSSNYNYQNRKVAASTDVNTYSQSLSYRFTVGQNVLGLELTREDRNPDPGATTSSYRAGFFWTYHFDKPARAAKPGGDAPPGTGPEGESHIPVLDLSALAPGTELKAALQKLREAQITGEIELPGLLIYETQLLDEIDQRQRLVLSHEAGRLRKAALIIDFDDIGRPDSLMLTFERIRNILIKRYGTPSLVFDQGDITLNLADDIRNGSFIRITEWTLPEGIIRYGIPRRLDGRIRMEVQYAKSFPPVKDTLWSVERVR